MRKWLPSYLWFSGILFQSLAILMALQTFVGRMDWRHPAHKLEATIHEKLSNAEYCSNLFRGHQFSWEMPKQVEADFKQPGAELTRLIYRNAGSLGMNASGHHIYSVPFQAWIRDEASGREIRFPVQTEQYFEVDMNNRIVGCLSLDGSRAPASALALIPHVKRVENRACERAGWSREMVCDQGTERCYPVAQCARKGS